MSGVIILNAAVIVANIVALVGIAGYSIYRKAISRK